MRRPPTARQVRESMAKDSSGLARTVGFYLIWVLIGVISAFAHARDFSVTVLMAFEVVGAVWTLGWTATAERGLARLYGAGRRLPAALLVAAIAAWPLAVLMSGWVTWLTEAFSMDKIVITPEFFAAEYGWGAIVLCVCVQPAVIEELAFRGIIQTRMEGMMKPGEAIVVASLAFAIMHFNLVMFLPLAVLGAYFGWLRIWSGSLWPCMLAHFLHNLLVTLDEEFPILPI